MYRYMHIYMNTGVRGVPERRIFFLGVFGRGSVASSRFRRDLTRPDPTGHFDPRVPELQTADLGPSVWAALGLRIDKDGRGNSSFRVFLGALGPTPPGKSWKISGNFGNPQIPESRGLAQISNSECTGMRSATEAEEEGGAGNLKLDCDLAGTGR